MTIRETQARLKRFGVRYDTTYWHPDGFWQARASNKDAAEVLSPKNSGPANDTRRLLVEFIEALAEKGKP